MLNRNSNSSLSKGQLPRGRKIDNNHNVHVISKQHGHSDEQHRKSSDLQDMEVYDFKKPLKLTVNRNKENMDNNMPLKKSLVKAESSKNINKSKKGNLTAKSIVGHKKIDSARSSLSKKAKSQSHIVMKKQIGAKKSLSPKSSRNVTSRTIKPLLTQRQKTLKPKVQQKPKKVDTNLNHSKNNRKKKFVEPLLILNDSSVDIAKQLQNLHKNQIKTKRQTKKISVKYEKKVIVSEAVQKQKQPLDTQRYERDSPEMITLTYKYKKQPKPAQIPQTQIKQKLKDNSSKHHRDKQIRAAITIQKAFRNYIEHRNIQYIQYSATVIQRWWRNCSKVRHSFNLPRLVAESSLVTIHDFNNENQLRVHKKLKISLIDESKNESLRERIKCLLEQNQSNVESCKFSKTKKIDFSPIRDQDDIQNQYSHKDLPLKIFSPKQLFDEQSSDFFQNLSNLQKSHKQKLIKTYNTQKQTIVKLWEQKLCSPRSQEGKLKDLDNRLNKQLLRFQAGIKEVLRGISMTKKQCLFEQQQIPDYLNSPPSSQIKLNNQPKLNTSISLVEQQSFHKKQIKQIQEISIQLSFVQQQQKLPKYFQLKFDPSLQGIQIYITSLFEYLEQNTKWRKQFYETMNQCRGITLQIIISNLDYAEEPEGTNESTFKIPLYKQYEDEIVNIITNQQAQAFNQHYLKLRLSNSDPTQNLDIGQLQYFHIQAIVDSLNQQFHKQKLKNSLTLDSQRNKFALNEPSTLISSFNQVKQKILKNGSYLCGFIIDDTSDIDQTYMKRIRQQRLRQMLAEEMKNEIQNSDGHEEVIEMKVCLGECVVMEIFEEAIQELWRISRKE